MQKLIYFLFFFHLLEQTVFPQWIIRTSGTTNNLKAVDFIDAFNIAVVGEFGTTLRSTNGGINWYFQSSGTSEHLYGVSFANENFGIAVGANGTILRTIDGGITWGLQISGTINTLNSVSLADQNNGITVGYGGVILRTTDGGITWIPQFSGTTFNLWSVFCINSDIWTTVGENGTILRSTDGGLTWVQQPVGTTYFLRSISCSDLNNCIAAGYYGTILKTTDGGSFWSTQVSGTTMHFYGISFRESNYGNVIGRLGTSIGTTDSGITWMERPCWTEQNLYGVSFVNADTGIAVGNHGVLRMTNSAGVPVELTYFIASVEDGVVELRWETATEVNNHLFEIERKTKTTQYITIGYIEGAGTTTEPRCYKYIDETVEEGKYFYRLKQIDYSGMFKYSDELEVNATGKLTFSLDQNFPNPFNPTTKIKYTIPEDVRSEKQAVILKVYDVLGNEIATLINESKTPGSYEVEFDGSKIPSGIYFYQLKTGRFVETKKMVLLK